MKCSNVQQYCWEMAGSPLPPAMEEHVRQCPDCKSAFEKANSLRSLVSLKRFEQPDSAAEARCIAMVQSRIDAWEEKQQSGWKLWNVFSAQPAIALSYTMAALVIGFLGMNMLTKQKTAPLPMTASEDPSLEAPNVAASVFQVASNSHPGQIQYGPGPSRAVNYEY